MIIATAVDDNMGMTFNRRRQSRDSVLCADLITEAKNYDALYMNEYSAKLFDTDAEITVMENFLDVAGKSDLCFVENLSLSAHVDLIDGIILYKWNRRYPAQTYFDIDLTKYKLISTAEFVGSSHEKITKEIYIK